MSEMKSTPNEARQESEIAIKFGKGLAQPFTGKDGTQYMRIQIPNADAKDKSPWQYFVVPAKAVHENQFGKGLWIKLPLHGSTTVSRDVRTGYDENGRGVYENQRRSVTNPELKSMVEFYKAQDRSHAIDAPDGPKPDAAAQSRPKPHRSYGMDR